MNKVTTINLNGNAYQLEEEAYELLKNYLAKAKAKLADDPDKDEILADFERAIAEKCDHYLRGRKNVINKREVQNIIDDMGPVEAAEASTAKTDTAETPPKRLYLLRDGAMLGGVCNGLAAYFNIDVTIVRLVFILLAFLTSGFWILLYFVLMIVVPVAKTPEQKAEARGERFSAHEVIRKAKQKYADLSDGEHWQQVAERAKPALSNAGSMVIKITRVLAALMAAFLGVGIIFATIGAVGALWAVLFGHINLTDQLQTIARPAIFVAVVCAYYLVVLPMLLIEQVLLYYAIGRTLSKQYAWWAIISVVLWIGALTTLVTIGLANGSRVHDYQQTHGYIKVYDTQICINDNICDPGHQDRKSHYYRTLPDGDLMQLQ